VGKYVEFGEICGVYMLHGCKICRICVAYFSAYFRYMQLRVMDNHIVIKININRLILHSFDILDLSFFNV